MAKSYNSINTNPIALQVPGNMNTTELSSNLFQAFSQSFKVHIQLIKQALSTKHIYLRGATKEVGEGGGGFPCCKSGRTNCALILTTRSKKYWANI